MIRNYFADLELSPSATLTEVRLAFRRLAKKFHPDARPDDPVAEESFKRIQEAYEHLNTPTKIARLKGRLSQIKALSTSAITRWKDQRRPSQDSEEVKKPRKSRQENLDIRLSISIQDRVLEKGGRERFQFVFEKPCRACQGRGGKQKSVANTCKKCAGVGTFEISRGALKWRKTCDDCYGKGLIVLAPCATCSGKGKVAERQAVEIQIPEGVDLLQEVRLEGLGHISFDGSKRGDLWLSLSRKT